MTKREFLDTVFALAPNEANAIMDAFDEYVDSNEPHWILDFSYGETAR